jgi:ATP-dependent DNA helicase RecG
MINDDALAELRAKGESLDLEFKSDRVRLSDKDIYEEIVALANTNGGVLLIGVEDDGEITGAQPRHDSTTDPLRLQAAIFNNTVPNINTRVSIVQHPPGSVIAIEVDRYPEPCATAQGRALRRSVKVDGKPETVPFYPRDHRSRRVDLGLLDFSAQPLEAVTFDDLDPLEFERLRQTVGRLHGDQSLLALSNEDLSKALRLVETRDGTLTPNIAGILLLARESVLRNVLPTHEAHFQVLDERDKVRVNQSLRLPLLRLIEEIESAFKARAEEREVSIGLFRLPVPDYSPDGFREAVNNALLHRDYTRLDAIYVQWRPDHLLITSPGGFPEGISTSNILVHEPKPRNPRLAEAFKRIGLVEQTGRGVDRIYLGQLRYGRPAPDYNRSDGTGVRVVLRGGESSLAFATFVYEEDRENRPLGLDDLIALNALFHERRTDSEKIGRLIQKGTTEGHALLERLHERGLVEGRGEKKGRVFHLSAVLYRRLEMKAEYVRAKGFEPAQQEQMIIEYARKHGRITRSDAMELCHLNGAQASRLLRSLMRKHKQLNLLGAKRGAHYVWRNGGK